MFAEAVQAQLQAIEADEAINSFESALSGLRGLGLDDFGYVLMSMPHAALP